MVCFQQAEDMSDITIRVADGITPELNRIARQMRNTRPLMAALGKQLEVDLRAHFRARDAEPNARGWPKRHFWKKEIGGNTALTEVSDTRAVVTIASPAFAHKVYGGTVTAQRGKALTIPLSAAAYRAGSASLFPGKLHRRGRALFDKDGTAHYELAASATHAPDPRAWPEQAKLERSLLARARGLLARLLGAK